MDGESMPISADELALARDRATRFAEVLLAHRLQRSLPSSPFNQQQAEDIASTAVGLARKIHRREQQP